MPMNQPAASSKRRERLLAALFPLIVVAGAPDTLDPARIHAQSLQTAANSIRTDAEAQGPANPAGQPSGSTAADAVPLQGMGWLSADGVTGRFQTVGGRFCCPEYIAEVLEHIRSNWQPRGSTRNTTTVAFVIQRDGWIVDARTSRSSGDAAFDDSAVNAVVQTQQVPGLPGDFPNPTLTVHVLAVPSPPLGSAPALPPAQQASARAAQAAYVGGWTLVGESTVGHIPGLPPSPEFEIELSQDLFTLKKPGETEVYRRDGTETDLPGYRKGMVAANDAVLNVTTTRVRPGSETVTIVRDLLSVRGEVLVVTRTLRVERPAGVVVNTPRNRWQAQYVRR